MPKPVSRADIAADATRYLGVPYLYGGTNRRSGLDCSGLVLVVCQDLGITSCPRTSEEQWTWTHHIDSSAANAGDLVFFTGAENDPPPGHVGILVAPGRMIDAPHTGTVVQYANFVDGPGVDHIIGYGRIPGSAGTGTGANPSVQPGKPRDTQRDRAAGLVGGWTGLVIVIMMGLALLIGFAFVLWMALH